MKEKQNQDSYLWIPEVSKTYIDHGEVLFNNPLSWDEGKIAVFGVFDGHGKNGHLVSEFVKNQFEVCVWEDPTVLMSRLKLTEMFENIHQKLITSIKWHKSGTTANLCVIQNSKILWVNLGDSRSVIFTCDPESRWSATSLSREHNYSQKDERERTENSGGKVQQFHNLQGFPFGPLRVWNKEVTTPGLAMSRSLGDELAHSLGVISTPGILDIIIYRN